MNIAAGMKITVGVSALTVLACEMDDMKELRMTIKKNPTNPSHRLMNKMTRMWGCFVTLIVEPLISDCTSPLMTGKNEFL